LYTYYSHFAGDLFYFLGICENK